MPEPGSRFAEEPPPPLPPCLDCYEDVCVCSDPWGECAGCWAPCEPGEKCLACGCGIGREKENED